MIRQQNGIYFVGRHQLFGPLDAGEALVICKRSCLRRKIGQRSNGRWYGMRTLGHQSTAWSKNGSSRRKMKELPAGKHGSMLHKAGNHSRNLAERMKLVGN